MPERRRLYILIFVTGLAAVGTWYLATRARAPSRCRILGPGTLCVTAAWDRHVFDRFRAEYGCNAVVDLRSDAEYAAAMDEVNREMLAVEENGVGFFRRIAVPPGEVPTPHQVVEFLNICADGRHHPLLVHAASDPAGRLEIRTAAMEAAYRHHVGRQPLEQALGDSGIAGSPYADAVRRVIAGAAAERPPGAAGPAGDSP